MKILIIHLLIAGIVFFLPVCTFAAHVGSPLSAPLDIMEEGRLIIGAEGNFVSERDLDTKNGITNTIDESTQVGLKIGYGVTEGVNFCLKVGTADYSIKKSTPMTIDYDSAIYYGAGLTYVFKSESNVIVAGDIQYILQPDTDVSSINYMNQPATNINGLEGDFTDLQLAVIFGYNFDASEDMKIIPYFGFAYDKFEYESSSGSFTAGSPVSKASESLDGDDVLGFITGVGFKMGEDMDIDIEARFVAESAFSIGFNYSF